MILKVFFYRIIVFFKCLKLYGVSNKNGDDSDKHLGVIGVLFELLRKTQ